MVNPVPMMPTPLPPPVTDWSGNLRDVIDTQQQTVKFLLGQWDALLKQVGIAGGMFGAPTVFAQDALIPNGWWQSMVPATPGTQIGSVKIDTVTVPVMTGQFWSDGNVIVTNSGGVTLARVAVMETT